MFKKLFMIKIKHMQFIRSQYIYAFRSTYPHILLLLFVFNHYHKMKARFRHLYYITVSLTEVINQEYNTVTL